MIDSALVRRLVRLAIEEDFSYGDVTSELTVPTGTAGKAVVVARQDLVVCGLDIVPMVLHEMGVVSETEFFHEDGAEVADQTELLSIEGEVKDLLSSERTILNFLQRLSGVATYTRAFALQAAGMVVLDTRKTIPGWRILDKYAVKIGGGRNHRAHLGDMILIKNNHIDVAPGTTLQEKIRNTMISLIDRKPYYMPIEVEVRNMEELKLVLPFNPQVVMLDNFSDDEIQKAFAWIKSQSYSVQVEVSGNLDEARLAGLRGLGVTCVSVGALTSDAPNADISMRIKT